MALLGKVALPVSFLSMLKRVAGAGPFRSSGGPWAGFVTAEKDRRKIVKCMASSLSFQPVEAKLSVCPRLDSGGRLVFVRCCSARPLSPACLQWCRVARGPF